MEAMETILCTSRVWTAGVGTTTDPAVDVQVPAGEAFYVSVGLNPVSTSSSQRALITITTDNGSVTYGQDPGIKKYCFKHTRVTRVALDTGASGGILTVWIEPR